MGRPIADWLFARATSHGAFEVELVDLREINLPASEQGSRRVARL